MQDKTASTSKTNFKAQLKFGHAVLKFFGAYCLNKNSFCLIILFEFNNVRLILENMAFLNDFLTCVIQISLTSHNKSRKTGRGKRTISPF